MLEAVELVLAVGNLALEDQGCNHVVTPLCGLSHFAGAADETLDRDTTLEDFLEVLSQIFR